MNTFYQWINSTALNEEQSWCLLYDLKVKLMQYFAKKDTLSEYESYNFENQYPFPSIPSASLPKSLWRVLQIVAAN